MDSYNDQDVALVENVANIQGLGAALKRISNSADRAKAFGVAQTALRSKTTTAAQAAFALKAGKELGEDAKRKLANQEARLERTSLYINKAVSSASATLEVLNNPPSKAEGVTNLDDGKSPINILVDTITVKAANSASANVDAQEYYNVADLGTIPSYYLTSEIEIRCNGRTILPPTSMAKFFGTGSAGMVDGRGSVSYRLNSPQFIKQGEKPQITIRPGANAAKYASNNSFVSIDLEGLAQFDV